MELEALITWAVPFTKDNIVLDEAITWQERPDVAVTTTRVSMFVKEYCAFIQLSAKLQRNAEKIEIEPFNEAWWDFAGERTIAALQALHDAYEAYTSAQSNAGSKPRRHREIARQMELMDDSRAEQTDESEDESGE